jgi:hypothetical protein
MAHCPHRWRNRGGAILFPASLFVFSTAETARIATRAIGGKWPRSWIQFAAIFNLSRWLNKGKLGGENGRGYPDLSGRHHVIRRAVSAGEPACKAWIPHTCIAHCERKPHELGLKCQSLARLRTTRSKVKKRLDSVQRMGEQGKPLTATEIPRLPACVVRGTDEAVSENVVPSWAHIREEMGYAAPERNGRCQGGMRSRGAIG